MPIAAVLLAGAAVRWLAGRTRDHEVGDVVGWERGFRKVWRGVVSSVDGATARVAELGASMPGAGAGRVPVLLVGGYANDERSMSAIGRSLRRDGFDSYAMTMPEFGMGDLHAQKDVLRAKVDEIRQLTGAEVVDVVGYSSGGFAARAAAQLDGGGYGIGRVITIATGNAGFDFGRLNWIMDRVAPLGVRQIRRGGELIRELHDTRGAADVVSIGTHGMDGVVPNPSSYVIDGKRFHAVDTGRRLGPFSRVTHAGIVRDRVTYETVRAELLAAR
jgi:triacylglycerol esterase/lipase EstA (alpha/beta hydrolase family)